MRKSRLSSTKQTRWIEYVVSGTTARTAAGLVGVNTNSTAYSLQRLRMIITDSFAKEMPLAGAIEGDESYFDGRRKGKRGRGAAGHMPVFGILKRVWRVYTKVIPDTKATTLMEITEDRVIPNSIVSTDTYRSNNCCVYQTSNTMASVILGIL